MLLFVSFSVAMNLGESFLFVLIGYLFLTLAYSFKIKQFIGMDVITLASLYTIRIVAGAAILKIVVSFWLFLFSIFIFFSLALVKRCSELKSLEMDNKASANGRNYNTGDYAIMMSLGTSSALISVLMFSFYTNSNVLNNQYQQPTILWLILPALSYWLVRMWVKTNRGEMHDDPIIFSLQDKGSLITIGFIVFITILVQIL